LRIEADALEVLGDRRLSLGQLQRELRMGGGSGGGPADGATVVKLTTPVVVGDPPSASRYKADLDAALIETYAKAGITNDPLTHTGLPPTIADLYDTLLHMGGNGPQLAQRLRKYTSGTFAGIFKPAVQHRHQQPVSRL